MARYDPFSPEFEHPLLNSSPDFGSRMGTYRSRPIGDQKTPLSFRERSKRLRSVEDDKNQLIEDLIYQLESMQKELDQLQYDCTREKEYTMESQFRENNLQDQLRQVKDIMDREPFVVALIDGNDMLFTKDLLCKGEKGGIEAVNRLSAAMNEFVAKSLPHLISPKLVVKIYADFKSLAEVMSRLKIVGAMTVLEEFVRGFNTTNSLFDFIDVGSRSGCISDRLCENVKLHLYDCHCHQVILGTSQNEPLADLLMESLKDPYIVDHITILEGPPVEKGLAEIKSQVRSARFDSVFRDTKLSPSPILPKVLTQVPAIPASMLTRVESNGTSGSTSRSASISASSTPAMTWATMTALPFIPSASASRPSTTRTSTPASARTPESTTAKPAVVAIVERNRQGQRIDKVDTTVSAHEVQRIKKLKLCNIFYLQGAGACTSSQCAHSHSYPLTKSEKSALREVARMTPCHYKMECDDPECIYGHRCPQSRMGDSSCWYGEDCRFWGWGHGIDTRVVKTTKV